MSAIHSLPLPLSHAQTEQGWCPQCDGIIPQGNITVTNGRTGLGQNRKQRVEGHCEHCKIVVGFHRELINGIWHRVDNIVTRPEGKLTSGAKKFRADLERAVADAPDEFAGLGEEFTHDSNGLA